jgi:translation initiation factor IF-1
MEGTVVDLLPNAMFRVDLDNGFNVLAHISGVKLSELHLKFPRRSGQSRAISLYDLLKGRITYRLKTSVNSPTERASAMH